MPCRRFRVSPCWTTEAPEAAASAAARTVLVALFPSQAAPLEARHAALLARLGDQPQVRRGHAWGESVGLAILAGAPIGPVAAGERSVRARLGNNLPYGPAIALGGLWVAFSLASI